MSHMYRSSGTLVNYWYAAGLQKRFKVSKPVSVTVFEIPLVIWRMKNGRLTALLDRCNHRNAPLSKGKIKEDCLVCPYHGWTYNGEGACVEIPSEGPHRERIPNKRVERFPVREAHGLVWVWMGREQEPNREPFEMPMGEGKGWRNYYMLTRFKNNITDLVENFMDVPHTAFVHKGWFRDKKQLCIKARVERMTGSVHVTYDQPGDSIGFSARIVNPKGLPMKHSDRFFMPNNTRVDYIFGEYDRGFIITSTCTPVRPFETLVYTLIAYKFGWLNPLARLGLRAYTRKVISQDVWIMDAQGENIRRFGGSDYKSTQCDAMHLYIESLRNHAAHPESVPEPGPASKEIEFWV